MAFGIYILTGPTASGKTDLALRWAEKYGAVILSCDSLCVYKGMDIGTAKPGKEEQQRVPHFGIDIIDLDQSFSVGDYLEYAKTVVENCQKTDRPVLVAGGSGFYLSSFFQPVVDDYPASEEQRAEVRRLEREGGVALLLERLDKLSPGGTGNLDRQNPRRVANALLRCMVSGKELTELQLEFAKKKSPFDGYEKYVHIIDRADDDLKQRIVARVQVMLNQGLLDEVKYLKENGLENNLSAASSIGYREPLAFLRGEIESEKALADAIASNTWQLVRKQRSWFRKHLNAAQNWDPASEL